MPDTRDPGTRKQRLWSTPCLGSFSAMLNHVQEKLSQTLSVPEPFNAGDTSIFRQVVQKGKTILPSRYQAPYVNVLANSLQLAEKQIQQLQSSWRRKAKRQAILQKLSEVFSVLAAPIVQLDSHSHEAELKAYLALSSNLYQRFLSDEKIARMNAKGVSFPQIDPLGFFTATGSEPCTWSPSQELPLALVSKPIDQMNCLPLWVIDGHEVGGHGIYSHLSGFEQEIADALSLAIGSNSAATDFRPQLKFITGNPINLNARANGKQALPAADFYVRTLRTYSQELAADVAGVLNLGPMFVNGLIIYLTARRNDNKLSHTAPLVETDRFNAYPPDALRALIAVEAIKHLGLKSGARWQQLLSRRLLNACGGSLPEHFSFDSQQGIHKIMIPCADIVSLVPTITAALLKSSLPCLGDRCLDQILTWSELDEKIVTAVSQRLVHGDCQITDIEDLEARHVVAASLMALEQNIDKSQAQTMASRIHKNGLAILNSFYLEQCILCAVPTYGKTRRGSGGAQLCDIQDLLKRVRQFKSQ